MPDISAASNLKTGGITIVYKKDESFDTELFGESSADIIFTQAGIPYALMEDSPVIVTNASEATATERYRIRGSDVTALYIESFPPPIFRFGSSYQPTRRRMPGAPSFQTVSVTFEPHPGGLPGDPLNNDVAGQLVGRYVSEYIATIEYSTNPGENDAEISINAGGQFLSIPPNGTKVARAGTTTGGWSSPPPPGWESTSASQDWKVADDNRDLMQFLIQIPTIEYSLRLRRFRNPRFDLIDSHLGRVNKTTMKVLHNAPPETVLFMGYTASQQYIWDGASSKVQPWSIDLHYSKKQINETETETDEDTGILVDTGNMTFRTDPPEDPNGNVTGTEKGRIFGWNHSFNPNLGEWVEMRLKNGLKPYRTVEFNDFLPVDGQGRFAPQLFI